MEENIQNSGESTTANKESIKSNGKNTGMAIVAYLLFFVPLLTDAKDDSFVKFHIKQSLMLILASFFAVFITIIPIIGWIIGALAPFAIVVLYILGIINAANGQEKELPFIGKYAQQIFKF